MVKHFITALFILYIATVLYIVLVAGNDHRSLRFFAFEKQVNLIPFREKIGLIVNHYFIYRNDYIYFAKELIGNLLLLFPLPFFLLAGKYTSGFRQTVLVCLVASICIEILQLLSNIGQADIDDVILNTAGGALGTLVAKRLVRKRISRYG